MCYPGPDTGRFRAGARYEDWVPNDFTVVHDGKKWHMLGITHPRPEEFLSPESRFPNVHEAEWQLFHTVSEPVPLKHCLREGGFTQAPLVLSSPELFQDEDGDWFIASAEWPNRGVSIAPIGWK